MNIKIKELIQLDQTEKYFIHGTLETEERVFTLSVCGVHVKNISCFAKEQYEFFVCVECKDHLIIQYQDETVLDEDINNYLDKTNIACNITNITPTIGITEIKGWAFSGNREQLIYQIYDQTKGIYCDLSYRKMEYQKLVECGCLNDDQFFSGFIITFIREENDEYELIINEKHIPLNSFFQEKSSTKRFALGNAFKQISMRKIRNGLTYLKDFGLKEFVYKLVYGVAEPFDYDAWFLRNRITKEELEEQKKYSFVYSPKISILVPTFNTPIKQLREMIDSVKNQSYSNWELCIADGSNNKETKDVIQEYVDSDERIKVVWLDQNYGISGNTNKALELATGEYVSLFDHDDTLELNALFEVIKCLQDVHHDVIYTDEDKLNDETGRYEDPNLKSDYNVDLLLSHNYITHFFVTKTKILRDAGGFNSTYDGAQDYDVIFKCTEQAESIHHIPLVLYHWRMTAGSTALDPESKMYAYIAGQNAIQAHLDRIGVKATVERMEKPYWGLNHVRYDLKDHPLVSIIIPNYDHVDVLKTCIDSLFNVNRYQNIEIIIVENNSKKKETFDYYKQMQEEHRNVKVISWENKEFNYSSVNNYGVEHCNGEYLLFLNNDTQMMKEDALEEMLGLCMREDVGAVGAKLLYENNTIQHAGVVLGFAGYARHIFNDIDGLRDVGFMMRAVLNSDYSAVTAACMMTKKTLFNEVHGFDERFRISCNDIDYCLKVREKNKLVVYNGFSLWHHFESKSRGYENNLDKVKRFDQEVSVWQQKWKDVLTHTDNYYNPNFKIEDEPFEMK